jgi:hypothetical protein
MPRKDAAKELRELQAEVQHRLSQVSLLQQEQRELRMQVGWDFVLVHPPTNSNTTHALPATTAAAVAPAPATYEDIQ